MSAAPPRPDGLPRAWGEAALSAAMRAAPEDFVVEEVDGFEASGQGEHLLLTVLKRGMNTAFAARCIAEWAGVAESAVGYAGLKDRHALARQRFSVHLPGREAPAVDTLESGGSGPAPEQALRVLHAVRHARKLPRGALAGNRFVLTLREVEGDAAAIEARLQTIADHGVPNYFGAQRFGHDGDNVAAALAMFGYAGRVQAPAARAPVPAMRRMRRDRRSLLLSAARSELFNRVLAARVRGGNWNGALDGEVWILDGNRSVFGPEPWTEVLAGRLQRFDIHPSAPLWGRGVSRATGAAQALEAAALQGPDAECLRLGLEAAGLRQERRATRLRPDDLRWSWPENGALRLDFRLPPGAYATAVLAELGTVRDAARRAT